jgi:mRNA-degrading endonuclease HigB of HigAB toxin-antitoxin module
MGKQREDRSHLHHASMRPQRKRLVVWINYPYRVIYIRFVGTHQQYDAIDAQTV